MDKVTFFALILLAATTSAADKPHILFLLMTGAGLMLATIVK